MDNKLPADTKIGTVSLTISDMERSLDFYQNGLGLKLLRHEDNVAHLGAGEAELLKLTAVPQARVVRGVTGLYHFALLLPNRVELAGALRHFMNRNVALQGFSDHLVSEAIYLADPDGNGIEVYRDRPRSEWPYDGDRLQMATDPLDLRDLLAELSEDDGDWDGMPAGTTMGHIHLHVANIPQSEAFYRDVLGFDLMVRYGHAASFLAAGGYHHHVGINTWAGAGAPPPPADAAGLRWFAVLLPSQDAVDALLARLDAAAIPFQRRNGAIEVQDPSQNRVRLRAASRS